ncbi:MAG: hybrid sensor histidine kinase/response regulator [Leptolyngbya sp.]|nr:MAG: hybrid sensor histidine kinase/response regulator [Leptolyngbya sp.]
MNLLDTDPVGCPPSETIQILIVEDEYVIAANLQENLETLGYDVVGIASSATEAIETAGAVRPDLVLMDIRLQGEMDGVQAAEQIWTQLQIPVVYVTGNSDKSTLDRAKVTCPFGYILKPVKSKELYVAIETALSRYEREQLMTTVLRSIGDGMIVTNTQGYILFLNRAAELLTGWQQAEARDRALTEVFNVVYEDTRQPIGNVAVAAIQQNVIVLLDDPMLLTTKAGMILPVTDSVAPIQNQKGVITGAVLIFRDDTQRRLQEAHNRSLERTQVLERQKEELERLNYLKDDFLSTVSHELRSPLTNIKMAIKMLEMTLNQQEGLDAANKLARMTRYINVLRDQCDRELSLVNDLLELQQLEAGEHPIERGSIDLNEWIVQAVEVFQERARSREQDLQVRVPPDLPVLVSDLAILTRIFTELLTNACKYTPPGEAITVTVRVQPENQVQLIVCNSGVEISADELTHIFDKFYRIPTSDRWQQGGTGLGLALIKKMVTYLGGSIWAESSAGQTCFIVDLPILQTP